LGGDEAQVNSRKKEMKWQQEEKSVSEKFTALASRDGQGKI